MVSTRTLRLALAFTSVSVVGCKDDSGSSGEGSASADEGSGTGDGDADGTADSGDGDGDADDGQTIWDVLKLPDVNTSCEGKCGGGDASYIFIANSQVSQMSKINTQTMVEEGRYLTQANAGGDPSRTSVSIDGQMGSINNRGQGGVLTVWSLPELCDPNTNGVPGLQTSTGPGDVLPWGEDDCVAWFNDLGSMRPIAWVAGPYNEAECRYDQQKLWTATSGNPTAYRLNRDTGATEETVPVPMLGFGYGGASDADGNFWLITLGAILARVDAITLDVQYWTITNNQSVYGITVGTDGKVWMSANMSQTTSAVRFDPETEEFAFATGPAAYAQSGIAEDAEGRMWMNDWNQPIKVYPIDMETMVTGAPFTVVGASSSAKGVSVDKDGYVWTAHFDNRAYRLDIADNVVEFVDGLNYPYTYSDMTGGALTGVTCGSPTG